MMKKSMQGRENLYDYMVKLIIIGDSGVGKTNILTRFCEDIFKDTHVATIGVDFNVKTIQVEDKKLRLQVWDTAGQQRFKTITQTYYKGAAGIILVYSVDNRESFDSIQRWIGQVSQRTPSSIKKILIANKIDIKPEHREISREEGEQMAQRHKLNYMEVSAKCNTKIDEMFYCLCKDIKAKLDGDGRNQLEELSRTITLNASYQAKRLAKESDEGKKWSCMC